MRVQDRRNGRLVILIDHFPGGIGQPNAEAGLGVDEKGHYILHDSQGVTYTWNEDGSVTDSDGAPTPYRVSEHGDVTVTEDGQESPGGNVFLADGEDPNQTLLTARTCYLQMIYSDDDGETWSAPVNLNQDVKEEWMSFCGTSPGTGVQLRSGRLVIPIYYNGDHKRHFSAAVVYSDDGGTTWKRGKSPQRRTSLRGPRDRLTNARHRSGGYTRGHPHRAGGRLTAHAYAQPAPEREGGGRRQHQRRRNLG